MKMFDARLRYGAAFMKPAPSLTLGRTLHEAGADSAVVTMEEQYYYAPEEADALVRARIASCPGAYGLLSLVPTLTGEVPEPANAVKGFAAERIAGYLYAPDSFRLPDDPVFLAYELGQCQALKIPVFYRHGDGGNTLERLAGVLRLFPELTVVLSSQDEWPNTRKIYPLMAAYKNLCLCCAEFVWLGATEEFCAKFGSERLLYASSYPERYPGGAQLQILNAELKSFERENIFAGNLQRLIGGCAK